VSGVSQRPPIQLKSGTFSLAFSSPYIVSLNSEFVVVYKYVQTIICVCVEDYIYYVHAFSWGVSNYEYYYFETV